MRLPPRLREGAGIVDRAIAEPGSDSVVVLPPGGSSSQRPAGPVKLALPDGLIPARVDVGTVGFAYGERTVLSGLSHEFGQGRMTVITGRSGSGKSTLLRLIAGLDRPGTGELTIDGHAL